MKLKQMIAMFGTLALAVPLAAQMFGPKIPTLSGVWHPVVGTGAIYEFTKEGKQSQLELSIVGKEDVDGKTFFWQEFAMTDPRTSQPVFAKTLVSVSDAGIVTSRMVLQMAGMPPMEMPYGMGPGGRNTNTALANNIAEKSEIVGTDSITVPAGTFSCTHYHMKDGTGDGWVSDKVSPWGLVKSVSKDGDNMVLVKVLTDAKDHITGTPQKFDPAQMMRNRPGQQGQ
jgi:hypothetical protein